MVDNAHWGHYYDYYYYNLLFNIIIINFPCGLGTRLQPMPALMRVVRGDHIRDVNCPTPPAHCMLCLLACNGAYKWIAAHLVDLVRVIYYYKGRSVLIYILDTERIACINFQEFGAFYANKHITAIYNICNICKYN